MVGAGFSSRFFNSYAESFDPLIILVMSLSAIFLIYILNRVNK